MVDVTPMIPPGRQVLEAYGGGGFKVSGERIEGSLIVLPEHAMAWPVTTFTEITLETLSPVWQTDPGVEILLLGCGASLQMPAADLRQGVREAGPVLEPMDTGAACRTFNVLMAEGRRVAAALIAIS